MHCTEKEVKNKNPELADSQFKPTGEDGVTCQAQCWRNSKKTKNLELYGLDDLMREDNPFHFTARDLFNSSWASYQLNHYRFQRERKDFSLESFVPRDPEGSVSGGSLPVCMSKMKPGNYHEKGNHDKVFPCHCGDNFGNETMDFFNTIDMTRWVVFDQNEVTGMSEACQTSFARDKTNPVNVFITYCQLGTHWPLNHTIPDDDFSWGVGAHPDCPEFKDELANRWHASQNWDKVTCEMCWVSDIGRSIKDGQAGRWMKDGSWQDTFNFDEACVKHRDNLVHHWELNEWISVEMDRNNATLPPPADTSESDDESDDSDDA